MLIDSMSHMVEGANRSGSKTSYFNTRWGRDAAFFKQIDRSIYDSLKLADYMQSVTEQVLKFHKSLDEPSDSQPN